MVRLMSSASAPISMASAALRDQLAGAGAHDACPQESARCRIEEEFGQAFIAAERERAPGRGPREDRFRNRDAEPLGFEFGEPRPCDLGIGVGDRRDDAGLHGDLVTGSCFGGDLGLVRCLVREHGLSDDVADCEDVGDGGAHLRVDWDAAVRGEDEASSFDVERAAVGAAAHCDEGIVELFVAPRCRGLRDGL